MKKLNMLIAFVMVAGVAFSGPAFSRKEVQTRNSDNADRSIAGSAIQTSPYAKAYFPSDYIIVTPSGEMCDAKGNITPGVRGGRCFDISSRDRKSHWRLRAVPGPGGMGAIERVFKMNGNELSLWAVWERKSSTSINNLLWTSLEAQQFAGTPGDSNPSVAGAPQEPEKTAEKKIDDAVKKGILGILKGLK